MIKKLIAFVLVLVVGVYIGFQLPRGAGLVAAITSVGSSHESNYTGLKSNQAMIDFKAMFDRTHQMVLDEAQTQQEAIEGMRWLLRVMAMSAEVAADGNPRYPHFQQMDTLARKVGGDNPDAEYHNVQIDGQYDYSITGTRGTVPYIGFTITGGNGMTPRRQVGYINDLELNVDEQGNFTLLLTKEQPDLDAYGNSAGPANWIQIPEDASGILVREYIADRSVEVLPTLSIEILGEKPPFVPPTDDDIANALIGTSYAFLKLSTLHKYVLPELLEEKNRFIQTTSESLGGAISSADNLYMVGSYQLAQDEALVVRVEPPQSRYWNFTLESRWHETTDYLHRPVSLTLEEVTYEGDGKVEFVIAHQNPGHPNWLDTSGQEFGFMTFRWLGSKGDNIPMPDVKVVKLSDL